jgi:hypothetical protein
MPEIGKVVIAGMRAALLTSTLFCASCDSGSSNAQNQLTLEQIELKMRSFLLNPGKYPGQADIRVDAVKDGWCSDKDLKLTQSFDARPKRTWVEFRVECGSVKPFIAQFRWGDGSERYFVAAQ